MNKIKKMYTVWGIIVVIIFVLLTAFGFMFKSKSNVYKELENKLVDAEKKYVDAKFLYPENDDILKVTSEILISNGYMDALEVNGETCEGYALISKKGVAFEYKGYVSCKNYKTKGYEK